VIGMHLPLYQLFYVAAIPLLFSAVVSFLLGRVAQKSVPTYVAAAIAQPAPSE